MLQSSTCLLELESIFSGSVLNVKFKLYLRQPSICYYSRNSPCRDTKPRFNGLYIIVTIMSAFCSAKVVLQLRDVNFNSKYELILV